MVSEEQYEMMGRLWSRGLLEKLDDLTRDIMASEKDRKAIRFNSLAFNELGMKVAMEKGEYLGKGDELLYCYFLYHKPRFDAGEFYFGFYEVMDAIECSDKGDLRFTSDQEIMDELREYTKTSKNPRMTPNNDDDTWYNFKYRLADLVERGVGYCYCPSCHDIFNCWDVKKRDFNTMVRGHLVGDRGREYLCPSDHKVLRIVVATS